MARRGFSQNLPNFVKSSGVVGAVAYQSQTRRPSSSFHDESEDASAQEPLGLHHHAGGGVGQGGGKWCEMEDASPEKAQISEREVEEATRVLFEREEDVIGATSSSSPSRSDAACAPRGGPMASAQQQQRGAIGRLHPKPAVHDEIVRFGMKLASDPRIQSAICENLELRHGLRQVAGAREEGAEEVRRLVQGLPASGESSLLAGSYEVLGAGGLSHMSEGTQREVSEEEEHDGQQHPSNSFIGLGRSMRRKDTLADAGDVPDELLDELLRSDDEEDFITSKMFAETTDDQIRRYLRNLDLECVICHEYIVEATALDCGEGHTFCRDCIGQWQREHDRCPTCQKQARTAVPMRQLDAMIEKFVRASNLWDEIISYYRRKTLSSLRQGMDPLEVLRPRTPRGAAAEAGAQRPQARSLHREEEEEEKDEEGLGGAGEAGAWWRSEALSAALSVAAMILLVALFRRGARPRRGL